ncbi:MAG TPA: hypothetical protein VGG45_04955 [Terracidiphilus sp.]|jgi:invasion protein IalB
MSFKIVILISFLIASVAGAEGRCAQSSKSATAAQTTPSGDGAPPSDKSAENPIEALAGTWDVRCSDKGCIMSTDVLIGDPDHPSDPKHPEYITVSVAINRSDRKPAFFAFDLPANADREQGVLIRFTTTVKDGDSWKTVPDKGGFSQLDFNSCDENSCVARVHSQILNSDGSPGIDLLDKFQHSSHIYFIYTKKRKPYRALQALFPFQRAYQHLMETELKPTAP